MKDQPQTIYHFTNLAGLSGILKSGRLWATDIRYLNDAQELFYGLPEIANSIEKIALEMPDPSGENLSRYGNLYHPGTEEPDHSDRESLGATKRSAYAARTMLLAAIDGSLPQLPKQIDSQMHNGYVTCFTEESDTLSQWRGYAGGNGFAIGFNRKSLSNLSVSCWDYANGPVDFNSTKWMETPIPPPVKVHYGDASRARQIQEFERELKRHIEAYGEVTPHVNATVNLITAALSLKIS